MAWRKIKVPATLENTPIVIHYNAEYGEYRVRITGKPEADYFTTDKNDAFATGQQMRNTGLKKNPAPKRKTAARTMKAAVGYVNRPSQITKKAPTKRLKKRRTINLQTPRGVFPNPSPRQIDETYAREIFLYGQNDGDLYRQQTTYIIDNLAKKYAAGKYDHALGRKMWKYWADNATKKYAAEFGLSKTGFIVNVPTRQYIAELAENYYFDHVTGESVKFKKPVKARSNPSKRETIMAAMRGTLVQKKKGAAWATVATFPKTPQGANDAIMYAKAYAKLHPTTVIQVIEK